jgi:hypothetical protein
VKEMPKKKNQFKFKQRKVSDDSAEDQRLTEVAISEEITRIEESMLV